jgi:hypothetical protein
LAHIHLMWTYVLQLALLPCQREERSWQLYRCNNWSAFRWAWSLPGCYHRDVLNPQTDIL